MKKCYSDDDGEIHTTRNGYHLVISENRGKMTINIDNSGKMSDASGAPIAQSDKNMAVGYLRLVRAPESLIRRLR